MAPGAARAPEGVVTRLWMHFEPSSMEVDGLYPWSYSTFVENLKQQINSTIPRSAEAKQLPRQNVRISFASIHCAAGSSSMEIERVLAEGMAAAAPQGEQRPKWSFRFPFIDDANPSEAETALNHVYAGTMARTLSQVCVLSLPRTLLIMSFDLMDEELGRVKEEYNLGEKGMS